MSDAAIQARAAQDKIVLNKEYVNNWQKWESNVRYESCQHVMELSLHVWRVIVGIIAAAVKYIVAKITIIKID